MGMTVEPLTVRDACAELRCSRWTLDRLFKAGELTKITERRKVYVDAAQLREYIRQHRPALAAAADTPTGVPQMTPAQLEALATLIADRMAATGQQAAA